MLIFLLDAMTAQDTKTAPDPVEVMARAAYESWAVRWERLTGEKFLGWDEPDPDDRREDWLNDTRATLAALSAAGFKVLPGEPTKEMLDAVARTVTAARQASWTWRGMWQAAKGAGT